MIDRFADLAPGGHSLFSDYRPVGASALATCDVDDDSIAINAPGAPGLRRRAT